MRHRRGHLRTMASRLDWTRFERLAAAAGASAYAFVPLRLAADLIRADVPTTVLAALRAAETDDGVLDLARERILEEKGDIRGAAELLLRWRRRSRRARAAAIGRALSTGGSNSFSLTRLAGRLHRYAPWLWALARHPRRVARLAGREAQKAKLDSWCAPPARPYRLDAGDILAGGGEGAPVAAFGVLARGSGGSLRVLAPAASAPSNPAAISRAAGLVRTAADRRPRDPSPASRADRAARLPPRHLPCAGFSEECLRQSLALFAFLSRMGHPVEIHFGIRKEGEDLGGHSWVALDGHSLGERDPAEDFRTIYSLRGGLGPLRPFRESVNLS